MCSVSTRLSSDRGIEYSHFGQVVLSDARTFSKLICCFLGVASPKGTKDERFTRPAFSQLNKKGAPPAPPKLYE